MEAVSQPHSWKVSLGARMDALIERPLPLFLAIFFLFLIIFGASILLVPRRYGRLIVGDGIYYYVYLRSAVLDHDLDFTNDYTIYQQFNNEDPIKKQEMLSRMTPIGKAANLFSVGPAILWSPVYLVTHGIATLLGKTDDGYSFGYEAPILFLSIAYGFAGILLMYQVVAGMFTRFAAFVAILAIWLATNVVYYMGVSPSASHVLSLFASSLFVYLWWRGRNGRTRVDWFVWGVSAGLMALVRWQDILIALLALFEWGAYVMRTYRAQSAEGNTRAIPWGELVSKCLVDGILFVGGTVLAFIPQMIAWQILYGSPLTAPQGGGFFQFFRPEMLNVWFSTKRGLFSWSPILLLGLIGLIPLYRKNRLLAVSFGMIFLLETYVNSIVNDWWGGEAFGARRFISLMPFFALGLAALIDAVKGRVPQSVTLVVLGLFIVWNNLFILQYDLWLHGIGQISAIPTLREMTVDKFIVPFQALAKLRNR